MIQKGLDRQLVLYWYQSHGRVVASEYWGKFYLVRDAVRMNRTDAALVRVIVPMAPNDDNAEAAGGTARRRLREAARAGAADLSAVVISLSERVQLSSQAVPLPSACLQQRCRRH